MAVKAMREGRDDEFRLSITTKGWGHRMFVGKRFDASLKKSAKRLGRVR